MDQDHSSVYKPLQHDQIRLVKFNRDGGTGGQTSAILEPFPLQGPVPPYHALSYTWLCDTLGVAAKNHNTIEIRNQRLPVLDALQPFFHALNAKAPLLDNTWWWIDSICIDLDNVEERSQQVQLMGRIYRSAHKVVFWLGRQSADQDGVIDFIEILNKTIRNQIHSPEEIRAIFQQPEYEPRWAALTGFFRRRWWTRVWTLQEYALPTSVEFWYGMRSVSRTAVDGALMAGDQCTGAAFKGTLAFRHGFNRRRVQRLYALGQGTRSVAALVAYGSCFESTDDRDRLYGIRALATDSFLLKVDYSLSVEQVYLNFAKSFIDYYKSLDIICFASLYSAASSGSSLPSWVPDWRARVDPLVVPLMASQSAKTHIGNLRPPEGVSQSSDLPVCYAASKDSLAAYEFEGSKLVARGTVLDTIDGLAGSRNSELVQSSAPDSTHLEYSPSAILKSVSRSLVQDRRDRYLRFAMPSEEFFQDFMCLCKQSISEATPLPVPKEFREWLDWTKPLRIRGHSFESILMDSKEAEFSSKSSSSAPNLDEFIMNTFFNRFFDTVVRMSLRLTVTHSGHIGLAPAAARKGDLVCVLYGCSVPVLLRQSEFGDSFTFVGECFLDGFMEGEGLEQPDLAERVFCIE
ncbi:uncharacterized protein NECHADRAFT_99083 [Fusarium vanettenii 77-13-4]|uniref:Heterokaryon incompatibility domain-containing protein n=1 Tax=Fusarium vanettenii (strain ATCC MYA-4622 / CBS 123669 / FGSC 9596 / NRRL 45880 / 77-13-4) TaxID=660122 RepID=C7Z627_FUSV7|nr:uncharacterized protein NECHADRAFT_99083 [Fusarium vanettenii 77-13-4]EEU40054.1 hypothetical protein NECHADRAFT_99083 [Fusarium vanettenii 77-13-4]